MEDSRNVCASNKVLVTELSLVALSCTVWFTVSISRWFNCVCFKLLKKLPLDWSNKAV